MASLNLKGKVAAILNPRELAINIGANAGVKIDMIFRLLGEAVLKDPDTDVELGTVQHEKGKVKIGYFCDRIFSFYYPENLEALEAEGAELVKVSSYENKKLPDIDGLYIGGGFPESNIEQLTANKDLMISLKSAVEKGLPVYAECGGLIYLGKSIEIDGKEFNLSGILPVKFKMNKKPVGHGYSEVLIDGDNPFFKIGTTISS